MHFFFAAVLLSVGQAQEHPVLRAAKDSLSDPNKPFTILVSFKVKEGQGPKFEAAVTKMAKETRKEKGNLAYEVSRIAKGTDYAIYERWENLAALEAHLKTEHFKAAMAELDPLLGGGIEVRLYVPVN